MEIAEKYIPSDGQESDRILIIEHALAEGGLIDRHMKWVETGKSPTAELSDKEYGYLPLRFNIPEGEEQSSMRPSREAINFRTIATSVLELPRDTPDHMLSKKVNDSDKGWFRFLVSTQLLTEEEVQAMEIAANGAFTLDMLTEDNLTAYVRPLDRIMVRAKQLGLHVPAIEEWMIGNWPNEEDGHKLGMNEYGQKMDIISDLAHAAGRSSQLRAGIDIDPKHVTEFFAYVAWQELSTYFAHRRNGALYGPVGNELLSDISADESRHHVLYFDSLKALMVMYPEVVVRTLHSVLKNPYMPGMRGIPLFKERAAAIDRSAQFGREHSAEAARTVLKKLNLLNPDYDDSVLSDEGKMALAELRDKYLELKTYKSKGLFILDKTLTVVQLSTARKEYLAAA